MCGGQAVARVAGGAAGHAAYMLEHIVRLCCVAGDCRLGRGPGFRVWGDGQAQGQAQPGGGPSPACLGALFGFLFFGGRSPPLGTKPLATSLCPLIHPKPQSSYSLCALRPFSAA